MTKQLIKRYYSIQEVFESIDSISFLKMVEGILEVPQDSTKKFAYKDFALTMIANIPYLFGTPDFGKVASRFERLNELIEQTTYSKRIAFIIAQEMSKWLYDKKFYDYQADLQKLTVNYNTITTHLSNKTRNLDTDNGIDENGNAINNDRYLTNGQTQTRDGKVTNNNGSPYLSFTNALLNFNENTKKWITQFFSNVYNRVVLPIQQENNAGVLPWILTW